MGSIELQTVIIYEARRDGRPVGFGIDREELRKFHKIRPNSKRAEVVAYEKVVGVIDGEVLNWNADDATNPSWKVHWNCPQCGQETWEDWFPDDGNPFLGNSMCDCVEWWLVHWSSEAAAIARKSVESN